MADTRKKNANWQLPINSDGTVSWPAMHAALLMDLRDELRDLNLLLGCWKFKSLPDVLRRIDLRLQRAGLLCHKRRRRKRVERSS